LLALGVQTRYDPRHRCGKRSRSKLVSVPFSSSFNKVKMGNVRELYYD